MFLKIKLMIEIYFDVRKPNIQVNIFFFFLILQKCPQAYKIASEANIGKRNKGGQATQLQGRFPDFAKVVTVWAALFATWRAQLKTMPLAFARSLISSTIAATSQGGTSSETPRRIACLQSDSTVTPSYFKVETMRQASRIATSSPCKADEILEVLTLPSMSSPA